VNRLLISIIGLLGFCVANADNLGYSPDGGLVSFGDFDYVYDSASRLTEVWSNGTRVVENKYDALGRRVIKRTPDATRIFVYDGSLLVVERVERSNGMLEQIDYWWGKDISGTLYGADGIGGLLYLRKNGSEVYVPLYDGMGNVVQYVDKYGTLVAHYAYDAFGNTIQKSGAKADELKMRFSTKYFDDEAGLYYFGHRFYSPRIARWLTRDPIEEEGGLNLYVVCDNDIVNKCDPSGCIPLDTVWDLGNIVYDICVGDNLALAADTAALMVPYVPAGASKLVKAAQLSKVKKICPGVKRIKVTYEYLPTMEYGFKHTIRPGTAMGDRWIKMTRNGSAVFRPGWGDKEIKSLIDEALQAAQRQGKIKPSQVDGFVYDTGRYVGAAKGEKTTKIRIHVSPEGKRLHAFPYR